MGGTGVVMRLAVSNIAWQPSERGAAHALLAEKGVTGLEIAPGLAFADETDPLVPSETSVRTWGHDLDRHGLSLVSMQSLLFGVSGAALFGTVAERRLFEDGIARAVDLGERLGCPNLVLGSPTARKVPESMTRSEADRIATDVLGRLGDRCRAAAVTLALEPNPAAYGTNFLNTLAETTALVRAIGHPAITVNFDIGALGLNGETEAALATLPHDVGHLSHVHISEPLLAPAPRDPESLAPILSALERAGYEGWVSIEMRAGETDNIGRLGTSILAAQSAIHAALDTRP